MLRSGIASGSFDRIAGGRYIFSIGVLARGTPRSNIHLVPIFWLRLVERILPLRAEACGVSAFASSRIWRDLIVSRKGVELRWLGKDDIPAAVVGLDDTLPRKEDLALLSCDERDVSPLFSFDLSS